MRHDLTLAGPAFRLRPIDYSDAPLVLELRSNPSLNHYLHSTSKRLEDQMAWLASYYKRPDDYYFVIERKESSTPEGVISLYDIDPKTACGEWGRWILKPGSLAAIESACLIYRCAFDKLGLDFVFCRTVADNHAVVSFHDSCGITARRSLPGHFKLDGTRVDAVEHQMTRQTWNEISPGLEKLALLTARRLQRA
jgi:RimJ/RimL family protein N-acetyltransferase